MGRGWDVNIYLIHLLKALCLCGEDMEKSTAAAEVEQESHQEIDVEEAVGGEQRAGVEGEIQGEEAMTNGKHDCGKAIRKGISNATSMPGRQITTSPGRSRGLCIFIGWW